MNELMLCSTEDGQSRIQLRTVDGTMWLSQSETAELFDVSPANISMHLKTIDADGKLEPERTAKDSLAVRAAWSVRRRCRVDGRSESSGFRAR